MESQIIMLREISPQKVYFLLHVFLSCDSNPKTITAVIMEHDCKRDQQERGGEWRG
jgi:hypothetical protein